MKNEKRFWTIVALVFVGILVWNITSAVIPALAKGVNALTPFLIAFITAYLLRHPVIWTERLFQLICKKKQYKWQHTAACLLVLVLFIGLMGLLVGAMIPNIISNLSEIIEKLPSILKELTDYVKTVVDTFLNDADAKQKIMEAVSSLSGQILQGAGSVVATVTSAVSAVAGFVFDFVLYLVASFMLLHGYDHIKMTLKRCLRIFITVPERYDEACAFLHDCDVIIEKYIVVRLVTSLGIGVVSYIGFLLFGLPYSILLALLIAITNLIPYIGPFVGGAPVVLVALSACDVQTAIGVTVFMLVIQQLEGNVLTPWLTSDALEVSPILVLIGIAVFGAMMGIPGMIMGAPIVAIIAGLIKRAVLIAEKNAQKKEKEHEVQ